jgi:hypothetical protein
VNGGYRGRVIGDGTPYLDRHRGELWRAVVS